jgi:hypothetical protein
MSYKVNLSDLKCIDDLYYIGDIVDVDGSPWVSKHDALQLLDVFNAELNQPIIDDWSMDTLFDDEF